MIKEANDTIENNWIQKLLILFLLLTICTVFSSIIPPLQSPDEISHLTWAYLLSKGRFTFITPPGKDSGGYVDSGLLDFMQLYLSIPYKPDAKINSEMIHKAQAIKWTREEKFQPNWASTNFPLVYSPAAVGLFLGRELSLSVDRSYRIARFLTIVIGLAIIGLAIYIQSSNFFSLAILTLPMSVFQFVTINADAITNAITILIISLSIRGLVKEYIFKPWMSYILGILLFVTIAARWQLIPLILFPLAIWCVRRDKRELIVASLAFLAIILWFLYVWLNFVDTRIGRETMQHSILYYYLSHPGEIIKAIWNSRAYAKFYQYSFIGVLGWLDTYFSPFFYSIASVFMIGLLVISISIQELKYDFYIRLCFLIISLCIIFITFFALLVTWSPFPAESVIGIQGRYFTIPMILMGYVLSGPRMRYRSIQLFIGYLLLCSWVVFSFYFMARILITRYYIM